MNFQPKTKKQFTQPGEITLYKSVRWIIIILFTILYTLLMVNVGIMSAATRKIKESLEIDNQTYGMFGSLNSTGRIIGTFLFMFLVNKWNRKFLIIIPLYFNALSVICFTLTNYIILLNIARTINGLCQVFGFVYFPIWIDQFGIQKRKTFMLTLIQLASPLGMVTGYGINTILGSDKWRYGFWLEGICEVVFITLLLFIPMKYFSKNLFFKCHFDGLERLENGQSRVFSIFHEPNKDVPKDKTQSSSFKKNLNAIIKNKIFIFSVLYKAISQIICVGLGFWLTDYLENQLHLNNNLSKFNTYVVVIVVGPMIGMSFGGIVGSFTGGYEKRFCIFIMFILHLISSIVSLCVVLVDGIIWFNLIMVIFFVFNAAVMPVITGLILWALPKNLKGLGNGISSLLTTFLGKFPAPLIYGYLQDYYGSYYNKIGMLGLMSTSLLGVVFLGLCVIYRYRQDKDEKSGVLFEKEEKPKTFLSANNMGQELRRSINQEAIATVFSGTNINEVIEMHEEYYSDKNNNKRYNDEDDWEEMQGK
jgi:MFS family permease